MHKLENPARVTELAPLETLTRLGLREGMTFADIGAGTGIFTTAAASLTSAAVCAVDPSEEMRSILASKKSERQFGQIEILHDVTEMEKASVDLALLCTVLHEIDQKEPFLRQIAERLKPGGRLAIIEFHKTRSPFGPPPEIRLGQEDVAQLANASGLKETERFTLGENFYGICFRAE